MFIAFDKGWFILELKVVKSSKNINQIIRGTNAVSYWIEACFYSSVQKPWLTD